MKLSGLSVASGHHVEFLVEPKPEASACGAVDRVGARFLGLVE